MIKQVVKYTDYNGVEREEEFYFNLNEIELAKMETSTPGGLQEKINRVVASDNRYALLNMFEQLILDSYGVKSPDGVQFIKNAEVRARFAQSEAYNVFFFDLIGNLDKATAFFNGILPEAKEQSK